MLTFPWLPSSQVWHRLQSVPWLVPGGITKEPRCCKTQTQWLQLGVGRASGGETWMQAGSYPSWALPLPAAWAWVAWATCLQHLQLDPDVFRFSGGWTVKDFSTDWGCLHQNQISFKSFFVKGITTFLSFLYIPLLVSVGFFSAFSHFGNFNLPPAWFTSRHAWNVPDIIALPVCPSCK